MRKTLLSALVAGAFAFSAGANAAPLSFNLTGTGGGPVISADGLDWAQTSFLAKGGNQAISNFVAGVGPTTFDVFTHAKLTGYSNLAGSHGLPGFAGEITVVAKFTEEVTFAVPGAGIAGFRTTGAGWVEMYYSGAEDSQNLTGANFNNGTLIMRLDGGGLNNQVGAASGNFQVTGGPILLDGFGPQNYAGQSTVTGFGSQGAITFNVTAGDFVNSSFLQTSLTDFSLLFNNISIGLPYQTVDPSDCFNTVKGGGAQCDAEATTAHVNGTYLLNTPNLGTGIGGYVPVVGAINGLFGGSPDFVAQTDFNSAVTGTPEPGTVALLGVALAGLGLARRRRS